MFNLLPKAEKDSIRREYRTRLAAVTLWFSSATFAAAALLLVPSYFLSIQKEKAASARAQTLSKSIAAEEEKHLDETLQETVRSLALLSREPPRAYAHELLARVGELESPRVKLESVVVEPPSDGKREVRIGGTAASREALTAFSRALERTGLFRSIELPLSNFAKDADIEFSIRAIAPF